MIFAKRAPGRRGVSLRCVFWLVFALLNHLPMLSATPQSDTASGLELQGDSAIFTTPEMIIGVRHGQIDRIFNRLTGTEYLGAGAGQNPESEVASGLVYAERAISKDGEQPNVIGPTLTKAGESVLAPKLVRLSTLSEVSFRRIGPLSVEYEFRSPQRDSTMILVYSLDSGTGDLLVQQRANGERHGLSGIRWSVGPVTCRGNLLLPAFNGIKATRPQAQYKYESSTWGWPMGWQIPMIIFADKVGGFSIRTEDPDGKFKEVMYEQSANNNWQVAFSTIHQAPFEPYVSAESVTWRLKSFAGDWTAPVDQYKQWAYRAFQIKEKEKYRPDWVDSIKLVIKHADYLPDEKMVPFLDELEKHVKPAETLLFLTFWKDDEEKQPIPYWLPNAHGVRFVKEARSRGFRVMYFANYIGIMPNHAKFAEFKDHFIRDPYSGKEQGWNLEGEWAKWDLRGDHSPKSNVMLYYVNPGYKPWRDLQVQQFRQLFAESPADGLFLDQAFLMFNDGNGTVDGATTIQANLEFHREVAEALPGIALGGESINEVTMQYESFCELHFLSLELKDGGNGEPRGWWLDSAAFDRMVPFTSRFVSPHTRPIGYVGFPETGSPYYEGWRDALFVYGGIPTLTKPTIPEMQDSKSEARRVMSHAFPKP